MTPLLRRYDLERDADPGELLVEVCRLPFRHFLRGVRFEKTRERALKVSLLAPGSAPFGAFFGGPKLARVHGGRLAGLDFGHAQALGRFAVWRGVVLRRRVFGDPIPGPRL